jgi:hypothetical protein
MLPLANNELLREKDNNNILFNSLHLNWYDQKYIIAV